MEQITSTKTNWINVVKIAGTWISYCIGSGFATGQDSLQYFCSWGSMGFLAIAVGICIHIYVSSSYLKLGKEIEFKNPMDVFTYYSGPYLGKIFAILTIIYAFLGSAVMIAGFGATLNQHFGIPTIVGNIILGAAVVITILLGLKRLVDIIGTIGPLLILITLVTGGVFLVTHWDQLSAGIEAAPSTGIPAIGNNWFMGGVFYATWAPLCAAPFLVTAAKTVNTKHEAVLGSVCGNVFYGLATAMLVAAFFCDIEEISTKMIPTLHLASQLSPIFSGLFFAVIILGIYSSAVPGMFTLCITFFEEKTKKFNIFTIVMGTIATFGTIVLPFDTLLNLVYSVYGYLGIPFVFLIILRQIRVHMEKKKQG